MRMEQQPNSRLAAPARRISSLAATACSARSSRTRPVATVAVSEANGRTHALKWTLETFASSGDTIALLHVRPPVAAIATPMGYFPLEKASPNVASAYFEEIEKKTTALLKPFQVLCYKKQVNAEIVILEDKSIVDGIAAYVTRNRITRLVSGSRRQNFITRRFKCIVDIPGSLARRIPNFCSLYVIQRGKLVSVMGNSDYPSGLSSINSKSHYYSARSLSNSGSSRVQTFKDPLRAGIDASRSLETIAEEVASSNFTSSESDPTQSSMYSTMQSDLASTNRHSEHIDFPEENYLNGENPPITPDSFDIFELKLDHSDETPPGVKQELYSHDRCIKKIDRASASKASPLCREILAKGSCTQPESDHQMYRRYGIQELELATSNFNESCRIGVGGYGPVYKGTLDHTVVAIKVLNGDGARGRREFHQEVEVLSRIRHPHILLLIGACPERGCLVYEYMENGSLEDLLFHRNSNTPFPWFMRFRIAFEVASALRFLHTAKPEAIVHCDLKPANILLDRNFVSKIGDVGQSKLVPSETLDSGRVYKTMNISGTVFYMDPEFHRTGVVTCRSDTYALGIILLQLLTGIMPVGLTNQVEDAIENDRLAEIMDKTAGDWPLEHAKRLAILALNCSALRRRDRPDLEAVLPELRRLKDASQKMFQLKHNKSPPSETLLHVARVSKKIAMHLGFYGMVGRIPS